MFSGCGKFILVGEHFILYDTPALALPWPEGRITIQESAQAATPSSLLLQVWNTACASLQLDPISMPSIHINSTIPQGCGLGSSAALCVALIRLLAHKSGRVLTLEQEIETATLCEGIFHGRSSGVDPSIAASECMLRVHMGQPHQPLSWEFSDDYGFVLAVGPEPRQTATAVAQVKRFSEESPERFAEILTAMRGLTSEVESLMTTHASTDVEAKARRLGERLTENHSYLREAGVSSMSLEAMVKAALDAGALGAKLTGAGMGGSMLAFAHKSELPTLETALQKAGAVSTYPTFPSQGEHR